MACFAHERNSTANPRRVRGTHADGVAFHISHDREEVVITLNRKGLESALVKVPGPGGLVVCVPTHRVHDRQPPKELAHLIVSGRLHHEVPMIGITL